MKDTGAHRKTFVFSFNVIVFLLCASKISQEKREKQIRQTEKRRVGLNHAAIIFQSIFKHQLNKEKKRSLLCFLGNSVCRLIYRECVSMKKTNNLFDRNFSSIKQLVSRTATENAFLCYIKTQNDMVRLSANRSA